MSHTDYSYGAVTSSYVKKGLGSMIKRFTPVDSVSDTVKITEIKAVASYSWVDAKTPTIIVPGSPAVWTNANPRRVPADSGNSFIDQNSYRMGRLGSPLAPIFAAIDHLGGYDFTETDLIADRNSLRKLFRWATGVACGKDFRIDVELVGQTCLFTRTEKNDSETVVGFNGFGLEYEKAATRLAPGCERTTGHHRIISLNFGGLNVLLRFSVDACTGDDGVVTDADADDLATALSGLKITSAAVEEPATRPPIPGISVVRSASRTLVPQSSLIELKTRALHRPLDWEEAYPQLYLSQTAYLYLAKHSRGSFIGVEKVSLAGSAMKVHAERAAAGMGRLKAVLTEVLSAVRREGSGVGMSLVQEAGKLALYRRKKGTGKSVGKEIMARFASNSG